MSIVSWLLVVNVAVCLVALAWAVLVDPALVGRGRSDIASKGMFVFTLLFVFSWVGLCVVAGLAP